MIGMGGRALLAAREVFRSFRDRSLAQGVALLGRSLEGKGEYAALGIVPNRTKRIDTTRCAAAGRTRQSTLRGSIYAHHSRRGASAGSRARTSGPAGRYLTPVRECGNFSSRGRAARPHRAIRYSGLQPHLPPAFPEPHPKVNAQGSPPAVVSIARLGPIGLQWVS